MGGPHLKFLGDRSPSPPKSPPVEIRDHPLTAYKID